MVAAAGDEVGPKGTDAPSRTPRQRPRSHAAQSGVTLHVFQVSAELLPGVSESVTNPLSPCEARIRAVTVLLRVLNIGAIAFFLSGLGSGCKPSPDADTATRTVIPDDAASCRVTSSATDPYVVEWASADKGMLETRLTRGLVAVSYSGCEMRVARRCGVKAGTYSYIPYNSRKTDGLRIHNVDELWAKLPLGAARLEAELNRAKSLRVDMSMVGRYESSADFVRRDQLVGQCENVTHVVWAVTVGAHEVQAEQATAAGAGVGAGNAGAGGSVSRSMASVSSDGETDACNAATPSDTHPPPNCGAVLRLELVAVGEAKVAQTVCPQGTEWDTQNCVRTEPELPPTLTSSDIRSGVEPHKFAAKLCGEKHGARVGTKVKVKLTISGSTGRVTSASATPPHAGTALGKCVAAAVKRSTFRKFQKSSLDAVYPFSM